MLCTALGMLYLFDQAQAALAQSAMVAAMRLELLPGSEQHLQCSVISCGNAAAYCLAALCGC